jgi:hypothetical protein
LAAKTTRPRRVRRRAAPVDLLLGVDLLFGKVNRLGYGELAIHAALWPTPDADRWLPCFPARFLAGDVVAHGWLERTKGAWLQTSSTMSR